MLCDRLSCIKPAAATVVVTFNSGRTKTECLCEVHAEILHDAGLCGSMSRFVAGYESTPIAQRLVGRIASMAASSASARRLNSCSLERDGNA